ncbi:YihY/virulence factor BrkB family protein [Campylobacter volucris]|uniref:YihY/virulence factor BrkB family protein n=1 Tax=Campylobacter volucris TaxID=1031542 RepID=A0A5C7DUB1_9BACT|nr:YihY/virulence factor BrkB family protein [Campylobacter volucris]TXE89062.1 YihY/virulence factor BrkB family protein [Campylobacter volucris]
MVFKNIVKIFLGLRDKEILNYAAALSFYTILSLIPLLFLCFWVFTQIPSFEMYQEKIKNLIFTFLIPTQQDLIIGYINTFLKNSVNIGLIGLLAMAITSLAFFSGYDYVINKLLQEESKSLWYSISSYWTLVTLTPLGLGLSFYISGLIQKTLDEFNIGINFFEILPYVIIWILFFISYSSSLSKKGNLKLLLITSFGASVIWYISKTIFVYYAVYNKTYLNVYGSFSVILFFFLWIYISWIIYLLGLKAYLLFEQENKGHKPKRNYKKS